jgi:hypothetical protein
MNKRNITGHKQILTEISITRNAFKELGDFFLKADENIANDPDDLREGIGRFPGLDRLMFLIPCVINRLEEDLSKSKKIEDAAPITEGSVGKNGYINIVHLILYQPSLHGEWRPCNSLNCQRPPLHSTQQKRWKESSPGRKGEVDILDFYKYMQQEWSNLLGFEWKGDKYQAIRGWIKQHSLDDKQCS